MKAKTFLTSLLLVAATISVYCEGMKAPVPTAIIEKAVNEVTPPASFNGAIIIQASYDLGCMTGEKDLRLAPIHWADDETFYHIGYKALLNKEPDDISHPPC